MAVFANVCKYRIVSYCVILCHSVSLFPLDSGLPPVSARSAPSAHSAQFAPSALYAQSVPSPSAETVPPQPTSQLLPPPLAHPASTKQTWETIGKQLGNCETSSFAETQ